MMRPPLFMCFNADWVAIITPTYVQVQHVIHLLQRRVLEWLRDRRAGIVHQHIQLPKGCDRPLYRGFDCGRIRGIRLDCNRFAATPCNRLHHRIGRGGIFRVRNGYACTIGCKALRDGCTNAPRTPGDERYFVAQVGHAISSVLCRE